jgi:hypothetical protein
MQRTKPPPVIKKKTQMLKTRESTKTLRPATTSVYTVCRVRSAADVPSSTLFNCVHARSEQHGYSTMHGMNEAGRQRQIVSNMRSEASKSISARAFVKAHVKAGSK